nr:hypothetical protein [Paraburkholderia atlantica]
MRFFNPRFDGHLIFESGRASRFNRVYAAVQKRPRSVALGPDIGKGDGGPCAATMFALLAVALVFELEHDRHVARLRCADQTDKPARFAQRRACVGGRQRLQLPDRVDLHCCALLFRVPTRVPTAKKNRAESTGNV